MLSWWDYGYQVLLLLVVLEIKPQYKSAWYKRCLLSTNIPPRAAKSDAREESQTQQAHPASARGAEIRACALRYAVWVRMRGAEIRVWQINGIANRTTIADGNTWNHEHIALLGRVYPLSTRVSRCRKCRLCRTCVAVYAVWCGGPACRRCYHACANLSHILAQAAPNFGARKGRF